MDLKVEQAASAVLMVKPVNFGYNEETAASNAFQQVQQDNPAEEIQQLALQEFNGMVQLLHTKGIQTVVIEDTPDPRTPDSIFPNNWISFHSDGKIVIYPMLATNRRLERRLDLVDIMKNQHGFSVQEVIDLSSYENRNIFLEGTGSIVFDYVNKIGYANRSSRTNPDLLCILAEEIGFEPVVFDARDKNGMDIYHTNVVMCLGDKFAVICLEAIPETTQRNQVNNKLIGTGHEVVEISYQQLYSFAGNMLLLKNNSGQRFLVMSETASKSLNEGQLKRLNTYAEILPVPIQNIEKYGGGSVRCMLAAIHLPKNININ
jgi:hypothetical protein